MSSEHEEHNSLQEQLKHQFEQNVRTGTANLDIDEDGYILGFKIPKSMQPVIRAGIENVKPWLIDNTGLLRRGAEVVAGALGLGKKRKTIGMVVESAAIWSLVTIQQLVASVQAGNKYRQERNKLYNLFSPAIDATGINARNNSVLRVAYQEASNGWKDDIKKIGATLPTLVPLVMYGWQAQRKTYQHYRNSASAHTGLNSAAHQPMLSERDALEQQMNQFVQDRKQKEPDRKTAELEHLFLDLHARAQHAHHHNMHEPEKGELNGQTTILKGFVGGASILSEIFHVNLEESAAKRSKEVKAWKMIEHLMTETKNQCGNDYVPPSEIMISRMQGEPGEYQVSLKQYILDIFQQHERELEHEKDPNKTFHREDGSLMNPLGQPLVKKLEPAVDKIAEAIAGGLDASALYVLVGGDTKGEKIILHGKNGEKTFANEAKVDTALHDLISSVGSCEVIKAEEYYSNFNDPKRSRETIKENLKTAQGMDRALFASLFSSDVLMQEGLKKKEIRDLRRQAHEDHQLDYFIAANVLHLNKKSPEELSKLNLGEEQIRDISELAEKIESGDRQALKHAVQGRDKSIMTIVSVAGLNEQINGKEGKAYWKSRQKEIGDITKAMTSESDRMQSPVTDISSDHPRADPAIKRLIETRGKNEGQDEKEPINKRFPDGFAQSFKDRDKTAPLGHESR